MTKAPSGGDGMPPPPDAAVVEGSPSNGVLDSSISKEIPLGNEGKPKHRRDSKK
jgi:hypothetical protein